MFVWLAFFWLYLEDERSEQSQQIQVVSHFAPLQGSGPEDRLGLGRRTT